MSALTAMGKAGAALQKGSLGRPDEMSLSKIHPDPNNSRRAEDENTLEGIEEQRELTEDIRKRGVKSPVSLRPHAKIAGEYMINYGHRRFKGAIDAGLATIPYFLDVTFDSYDQVKENLLHRKPSVWALAQFVQRKSAEKQSKGEIAEGLGKGKNQTLVTELLALIDAPQCLHQVHANGVTSTRTLYDLRRAYDQFPEQVDAWCASGAKITRDTIRDLLDGLRHNENTTAAANDAAGQTDGAPVLRHDVKPNGVGAGNPSPGRDKRQIDLVETFAASEQRPVAIAGGAGNPRHDTAAPAPGLQPRPAASELRHDVKKAPTSTPPQTPLAPTKPPVTDKGMMVQYRGKVARIAENATVIIVVDGQDAPLEVPLAELVFAGSK